MADDLHALEDHGVDLLLQFLDGLGLGDDGAWPRGHHPRDEVDEVGLAGAGGVGANEVQRPDVERSPQDRRHQRRQGDRPVERSDEREFGQQFLQKRQGLFRVCLVGSVLIGFIARCRSGEYQSWVASS